MKLRIWDRVLCAFSGLLLIVAGIFSILQICSITSFAFTWSDLSTTYSKIIAIVCSVILLLLGLHGFMLLFRIPGKGKGFIIQSNELGEVSISIRAMENMVQRCISPHKEINLKDVILRHDHNGLVADLRILLQNGVNIPQTVSMLQKEIKEYVQICSGVQVKEVRIMVETDNSKRAHGSVIEVSPSIVQVPEEKADVESATENDKGSVNNTQDECSVNNTQDEGSVNNTQDEGSVNNTQDEEPVNNTQHESIPIQDELPLSVDEVQPAAEAELEPSNSKETVSEDKGE